jgi:hypothetical protein
MQKCYRTRAEASDYLKEKGCPVAKGTLQKYATVGGGPRYVIFGNKALYTDAWLDEWVEEKISAPRCSTSEAAAE